METRITIAQMDEALEKFKQKISSNFIIGGSLALYHHGFGCTPNDIDMEIEIGEGDGNIMETLSMLNETYYGNSDASRYPTTEHHYRFSFHGVIFDVWAVNRFSYKDYMLSIDGTRYADVMSVLRAKRKIGRTKDISSIADYASQILSLLKEDRE